MNLVKITLTSLFSLTLLMSACSSGNSSTNNAKAESENTEEKAPVVKVKIQSDVLNQPYDQYLLLKDALFNNDIDLAKNSAKDMKAAFAQVDVKNIPASLNEQWSELNKTCNEELSKIEQCSKITDARLSFSALSDVFSEAVKVFGLKKGKAYLQHCPMAKNAKGSEGADWLDKDEAIANPYFGAKDEMKGCGETKESYTFE